MPDRSAGREVVTRVRKSVTLNVPHTKLSYWPCHLFLQLPHLSDPGKARVLDAEEAHPGQSAGGCAGNVSKPPEVTLTEMHRCPVPSNAVGSDMQSTNEMW